MTVAEVKKKLEEYPDDMPVYFAEVETGFQYSPVEEVRQITLKYSDSPDGPTLAEEEVVVIDSF